uniref:Uncharacterized protein n=1 Tax=Arion vulgaris TaxID=1028688 RepID=A0A0B6ZAM2_9EUPU
MYNCELVIQIKFTDMNYSDLTFFQSELGLNSSEQSDTHNLYFIEPDKQQQI